ncbi:MAG: hypothetical protein JWN86_4315 [Planctomycetota bacterium]|nr:hypothetical protein [Planctomycetota bacterium]
MRKGDPAPSGRGPEAAVSGRSRAGAEGGDGSGWIIETVVSPFHCLYQDALDFHKQSHLRLPRSEAEASRLARASLLLYLEAAEALVHQAAAELARPELAALLTDPVRPMPPMTAWSLLPVIVGDGTASGFDPDGPPWAQLAEMLALRDSWRFPGPPASRSAYYCSPCRDGSYEPLEARQAPPGLDIAADRLILPRTGLPLDPYALRPRHLDTARSVLDQAIEALDRRLGGALTKAARHRREPVRVVWPRGT